MSGYASANGQTIVYTDIPAGEIECCLSCTTYAAESRRFSQDLRFMQLRHADHLLSPELYPEVKA